MRAVARCECTTRGDNRSAGGRAAGLPDYDATRLLRRAFRGNRQRGTVSIIDANARFGAHRLWCANRDGEVWVEHINELTAIQAKAVEAGVFHGKTNLLVVGPTSSGKTLVGEKSAGPQWYSFASNNAHGEEFAS
jgi:hypothetical protein